MATYIDSLNGKHTNDESAIGGTEERPLFLYLLTQEKTGYGTYLGLVVCAENEEEARKTPPYSNFDWESKWNGWSKPDELEVELLGSANKDQDKGVVLSSFNGA